MNKLDQIIQAFESKIPKHELINPNVSKGSVGWHIEHSLLTFNLIIDALKKSNPTDYKWKFSLSKSLVFAFNKIPRGKAKAPSVVQPKNDFNRESMEKQIAIAKKNISDLDTLRPNNYFDHPFFGKLNLKPTKIFLAIHSTHHLKIINDIIESEKTKI